MHLIISNYMSMANLNRIKVVLVEKGKTGKWLAEEVGKTPCTVASGAVIAYNLTCRLWIRLQSSLMLM